MPIARLTGLTRFSSFVAHFHKQYKLVDISPLHFTESTSQKSVCYCDTVNISLPEGKRLDLGIELPRKVPEYKRHVLLVSPRNDDNSPPEWKASWQSKLELNPSWPYSSIFTLKNHLKKSITGSEILVNAISMIRGDIHPPEKYDKRVHFYVLPDMKLFKITKDQISEFAHFLSGGSSFNATRNNMLHFEDFLKGADNASIQQISREVSSSFDKSRLEYEYIVGDWALICGHYQRDPRCGIVGEDLIKEIQSRNICKDKNVGVISHIGGHKYAGNIIFYNHAGFSEVSQRSKVDALWFGKVLPTNLPLLVENLNNYKITKSLYRGGLQMD